VSNKSTAETGQSNHDTPLIEKLNSLSRAHPHADWVQMERLVKNRLMEPRDVPYMSVEDYLTRSRNHPERIVAIVKDQLESKPLSDACRAVIVVPVHNEEIEIQKTIAAIKAQRFNGIASKADDFCVVFVENNSIDSSREIIHEAITNNQTGMDMRLISYNFTNDEKGVGSARKLGYDIALALGEGRKRGIDDLVLLGIDGDNAGIPPDHFEVAVSRFAQTKADVLIGRISTDFEELFTPDVLPDMRLLHFGTAMKEFANRVGILTKKSIGQAPQETPVFTGQNHAMTAAWYLHFGGLEPLKSHEDTFIERITKALKGEIAILESSIIVNTRRAKANLEEYFDGKAWGEENFADEKVMASVRKAEVVHKISLTKFPVLFARALDLNALKLVSRDRTWAEASKLIRKEYRLAVEAQGIPLELCLSETTHALGHRQWEKLCDDNKMKEYGSRANIEVGWKIFVGTIDDGVLMITEENPMDTETLTDGSSMYLLIKVDEEGYPEI